MHFTYDANDTPMTVTFDCVFYDEERTYDETTGAFADDVEIWYTVSETYYYITNIQGDVIELLNSDGESAGYYRYDAWGYDIDMYDNEDIIYYNPLRYRGYIYDRVSGYYYLQTRFYDPEVGRFINADAYVSTGQGFVGNNMFAYCGNNPVVRCDAVGAFWESIISGVLHLGNEVAVAIGFDTAAIGAFFLDMSADSSGVYHASVDCWQQYFGYNDLYDTVFDLGTDMATDSFPFGYGSEGYTLWVWKGDYINLGAGAEMGIYLGMRGHRTVDTSLAMWMGMIVRYKGDKIIEYYPSESQWWLTGFNPNYRNVSASDLSVTFGIRFSDYGMYQAFRNMYNGIDLRWSFDNGLGMAFLKF